MHQSLYQDRTQMIPQVVHRSECTHRDALLLGLLRQSDRFFESISGEQNTTQLLSHKCCIGCSRCEIAWRLNQNGRLYVATKRTCTSNVRPSPTAKLLSTSKPLSVDRPSVVGKTFPDTKPSSNSKALPNYKLTVLLSGLKSLAKGTTG